MTSKTTLRMLNWNYIINLFSYNQFILHLWLPLGVDQHMFPYKSHGTNLYKITIFENSFLMRLD